jgi:tetratricopeptide (TPR) repeat protein
LAQIRDDKLFNQPDGNYHGECPICCLPLPLDPRKSTIKSCCCKLICNGCDYANVLREREKGLEHKCPYCRELSAKSEEVIVQNLMKRVKANDPVALTEVGKTRYGEGDYERAFEYFTKAAAFGDAEAHYKLSIMYEFGEGVGKDKKKEVYHLEEAVMGGHPVARYNLGVEEKINGRMDRAVKHFIITAKLGDDPALEVVKQSFIEGLVSKEDFEAALRGHQAAVDATKSEQREKAYAFGFYK